MRILDKIQKVRAKLVQAGIDERLDAELLVSASLEQSRTWLLAHSNDEFNIKADERLNELVNRRLDREPLPYILGYREFYGLDFIVTPDVLIPRPETELLVETVLKWSQDKVNVDILEIGTGSGCIGITLAVMNPTLRVVATDRSEKALSIAKKNFDLQADKIGDRLSLLHANWLEPFQDTSVDVVVANLPYVALTESSILPEEVRRWEPSMALYADDEGLAAFEIVIPEAKRVLKPSGLIALEVGYTQSDRVNDLLVNSGFMEIQIVNDLAGIPRVVWGNAPPSSN
ncbi:MAG: peptide chain release factor N(5)-glutamine methyltransferase [bacterium]